MAWMVPTSSWYRWRMPKQRLRVSGASLALVLTGLAVLACSCDAKPSDPAHGTDPSPGSGGNTTVGFGTGGEGGHGSGGAAGDTGAAARDAASVMGSGGQAGGSGGVGPGVGGSGSGGAGTADAAAKGDTAVADLPAIPDAPITSDSAPGFWTTPFVANCTPLPVGGQPQSDGHHRASEDCMQSGCHAGGSPDAGAAFLFGGTVRRAGSLAPYPSVEVAVQAQSAFYSACSATNGNFWMIAPDGGSLDWATATARARSANGEAVMLPAPEAACNNCHSQVMLITAP